ncbi:CHAT domain-containing protein [Agromyces sp. NPDC004153]
MDTVIELEILPGPDSGSYTVHVLRSVGGGEPTSTFTLDLDELVNRRPQLEESILASAVMARRVVPTTEVAIQDIGRQLFDAVFQGDVQAAYRTSLAVASDRGKSIQLVLRLSAPGLVALPWETLFDPETATYLCRKEPLVRRVPARHAPAVLAIDPPLRILGMVSSPRGLPALDVEAERKLLEDALRPQIDAGRVKISWVEPVTWSAVHDRLLTREWHVLHFIGHGTYDPATQEGLLAFVGQDGRTHNVPASSLADLIDEADPSPRLVLLNTCSSGTGGRDDLFSGTAGALAHSGIHAVAAMQFEISDRAAIEFSRGFYTALAHGRRIDDAVRSGRIEILGIGQGTLEWVTPVLYLRGDDTRLFDVAPVAETGVSTTADAVSRSLSTGTPPSGQADRPPTFHAADSGDIPSTIIPIIRPNTDSPTMPVSTGATTAPTDSDEAIAAPPVTPWWAEEETARAATTKPIPIPRETVSPIGGNPPIRPVSSNGPEQSRRTKPRKARRLGALLSLLVIVIVIVIVIVAISNSGSPQVPVSVASSGPSATPSVDAEDDGSGVSNGDGDPSNTEGEPVAVPAVSGKTIDAARSDVEAMNLTPATGPEISENHPKIPQGYVIRTVPAEGDSVAPGSTVQFIVSTGQVTVPDLVGSNWQETTAKAQEVSLTLGPETGPIATCKFWAPDRTVDQEPDAYASVDQNSVITVTYCP